MRTCKHFVAVLFILFAFDAAYACSCMAPPPPCAYDGESEAIFLGRVVGSVERKTYVDEHGNKTVYDVGTIGLWSRRITRARRVMKSKYTAAGPLLCASL